MVSPQSMVSGKLQIHRQNPTNQPKPLCYTTHKHQMDDGVEKNMYVEEWVNPAACKQPNCRVCTHVFICVYAHVSVLYVCACELLQTDFLRLLPVRSLVRV